MLEIDQQSQIINSTLIHLKLYKTEVVCQPFISKFPKKSSLPQNDDAENSTETSCFTVVPSCPPVRGGTSLEARLLVSRNELNTDCR